MSIEKELEERIARERAAETALSDEALRDRIRRGDDPGARGVLMHFTDPAGFASRLGGVLDFLDREIASAPPRMKVDMLRFLTYLALDLSSFVPEWHLLKGLAARDVAAQAAEVLGRLEALEAREKGAAEELRRFLRTEAFSRFKAEALSDEEAGRLADNLAGADLSGFVRTIAGETETSNLRRAAKANLEGDLFTEIGNDYAEFLNYVIWLGGSFVTTNPVLIKLAWDIDPAYWNSRVDEVILSRYSKAKLQEALSGNDEKLTETIEDINNFVTVAVVERNCRLLRPIFLTTRGRRGYVSLQVNPKAHNDGDKMVAEATLIYQELERRLGGVPNVVIKVPSTAAGLHAAEKLTARGIGVTVTLTFSLFQSLPFAKALQKGRQLISYIAIMNGRLAFPVRDELKKGQVAGGVEAARWAGVEVARKAARRLYFPQDQGGLGVDKNKVKIMIASLRIYEDWIPDISELWGIPVITIFPNVRRAYDAHERPLETDSLDSHTPASDLEVMAGSEIFRQSWWTPEDGDFARPRRPLTLEAKDAEVVADWAPVRETLTQFIGIYREMSGMVRERMAVVAGT